MLSGKNIVLGISGGIAAFKACSLASSLKKAGANVFVVMTKNATEFVAPLTFETLTSNPVGTDMFAPKAHYEIEHISLAKRADLVVVAPATANIIAKYACGIADDLLSTTLLATKAPVMIAPAMNTNMITHPSYLKNKQVLCERGVVFINSESGRLACGDEGDGRLPEPEKLFNYIQSYFTSLELTKDFCSKTLLVTAGATREMVDGVRFISNYSSGRMGIEIANAAKVRGAKVILIAANLSFECENLLKEYGLCAIRVGSTKELHSAVLQNFNSANAIIMAAAPADYAPKDSIGQKLKGNEIELKLIKNEDTAAYVGANKGDRVLVIFAAETNDLIKNARAKLSAKNADLCVANDVTKEGAGFETKTNIASILTKNAQTDYSIMLKSELAHEILNKTKELLK